MERSDRRLCLVLAEMVLGERGLQDGDALGDELGVPLAPVLLGEWHDRSVRSCAAAVARVVQQHQGEQTVDLGVAGQRRQLPGEPDGLGREVDVAGVALVEHEVQHSHHGSHLAGTIETGPADRALGPADPLRHGALGHEVGLRDLARGEAAHRPEREGDRRGRRQVGMRGQKVEAQGVVDGRHHTGWRIAAEADLTVATRRGRSRHVMNALQETVISQPSGSDGASSSHAESARTTASCTASSAVAKSAPRRTRTLKTFGTSSRSSTSSTITR